MLCPSEAGQIVCLLCAIVATYCLERQTPSCMLSSHRRVAHTGPEIVTENKDTWQTFAFIGNNILPLHLTRLGLHHWVKCRAVILLLPSEAKLRQKTVICSCLWHRT